MCLFFTPKRVTDYESATTSDTKMYGTYFRSMLEQGIYLAPAQYEAMFLSAAHSEDDIEQTLQAQAKAFEQVLY
jgi:glutamate-1-semialdehyde 2,1-aminomutase